MKIQELINLMGLPINSPEVKTFLESRSLKYPKKEIYSIQAVSIDKPYITDKKAKIEFNFGEGMWNPKYPPVPAERGGSFYFRLKKIYLDVGNQELLDWLKIPSAKIELDELFNILGERKRNSFGRYSWIIPLNVEKDICAEVYYDKEDEEIGLLALVIPDRPLVSKLPDEEFNNIMGKAINSPEIKAFLEKHYGVYPKKDTIDISIDPETVRANIRDEVEGQYYSLYVAGGAIMLTFGLKETTQKHFPLPAKKPNHYYPILNEISILDFYSFEQEDNTVHYPMDVKYDDSLDTIIQKWGEPFKKHEDYYWWVIPCNKEGEDVIMDMVYSLEKDTAFCNELYCALGLSIRLNAKK